MNCFACVLHDGVVQNRDFAGIRVYFEINYVGSKRATSPGRVNGGLTGAPAARPGEGPLAGMPILNVDKARVVVIIKRSLSVGYAGVDNDLFYMDKTMMLFGDGKKMMNELNSALKDL